MVCLPPEDALLSGASLKGNAPGGGIFGSHCFRLGVAQAGLQGTATPTWTFPYQRSCRIPLPRLELCGLGHT